MKPSPATPSKPVHSTASEADVPAPKRRGGWVVLLLGLALAVWIGVRVKAAMTGREAVAREHAAVAKTAAETASRPPTVKVVRATRTSWQSHVMFEGTLAPAHEADVGFKTAGRVASIHVKVGDRVRAGTVLASLDAREAEAQVAAATAQQQAAEAQLALAQDAERRTTAIVSSGAQAEATGVEAKQHRALAEAQLASARAQLALARANLANQSLTAPFDGTIARSLTGTGGIVAPGMPGAPQFHLADLSSLKLVGTVGEADAALVKVGAEVELSRDDARVVRGKVTAVVAQLDPATKRVPVEAVIANDKDDPLFAGALVRASIRGAHAVDVLALPHQALRPGSQDEVMVVKGDRLSARRIDFVIARDGSLLVRRGLDARDDVVAAPWAEAKDGDAIAMASKEAAPGAETKRGAP